jgi:putative SOS response-associated peptidase YedK
MCGRYAASRSPDDLVEEFEVDHVAGLGRPGGANQQAASEHPAPNYNVAPTDPVSAILTRPPRGEPDAPAVRQLAVLRWGLVPSWARDPSIGSRLINARTETVADKPAFRKAFARRRCLLPADGYYEWYETQQRNAKGKPVKQPFFICPRDGGSLAMAGLYEIWRDPARNDDDPHAYRWTCTVLTTSAEDDVGHLHDRMPLLVEPDRWVDWLDPRPQATDALVGLLVPAAPGRLEAYPVSTEVNSVRNNGAHLLDPLPPAEVAR